MNIEEIMKPYFDKKKEFDNKYIGQKNFIKMRLERLRDNKEKEIEEYVKNSVADRPDFYAGYGAMVRKDLEQAYAAKEAELEEELRNADKYYRVDVRELADIKGDLRKELFAAKKSLEYQIKETQLNSDMVMLRISTFKHIYDENHNVVNGADFRKLYEQSNELIDLKYGLTKQLEKVEEYLKLTELTKDEVSVLMASMFDWEKEEYNRRKNERIVTPALEPVVPVVEEPTEEVVETPVVEEPIEEVVETPVVEEPTEEVIETPVVEEPTEEVIETPVVEEPTEEITNLEEGYTEFIETVFTDIMTSAKKLRTIKLDKSGKRISTNDNGNGYVPGADLSDENIEMPNGIYLNKRDLNQALDNYRKNNKGRKFVVNGVELEINRKTVRKVKNALKECSTLKLLREKKISSFDIKRVFGKAKAEEYKNKSELARIETTLPSGEYVSIREFSELLRDLFTEKSPSWLDRLKSKFKRKEKEEDLYMDADYEQLESEASYDWQEEEYDYPIVKAKR